MAARVAAGPLPQLGGVAGQRVLVDCGVGERCGEPFAHGLVGYRKQQGAGAGGPLGELADVVGWDGASAHPAPVGSTGRDGGGERRVDRVGRVSGDLDPGQHGAVLGVRNAHDVDVDVDVDADALCGERDLQVVQRGAAAEQEVASVRVGRCEVTCPVGVQLDRVVVDPPAPWLGVVHRRSQLRVLDGAGQVGTCRHVHQGRRLRWVEAEPLDPLRAGRSSLCSARRYEFPSVINGRSSR